MSIATFIKEDLAEHLVSGRDLPVQLTFDSLAEHYNVSYTPVRIALAELIDEGLLVRGSNRRLTPAPPNKKVRRHCTAKLPVRPADQYGAVANDLVQLSFNGEPVFLREEATGEKYGISRSAIRVIFQRLATEGMLDHVPRRGWRLRPFKQDDFRAFLEVREALELKALELARPNLDPTELRRLLDANTLPESPNEDLRCDDSLHEYIILTADNVYIRGFLERQGRFHWQFFHWEYNDRETALETIRQHRDILSAMLMKNWSAARKALSHHIRNNHPLLGRIGNERKT